MISAASRDCTRREAVAWHLHGGPGVPCHSVRHVSQRGALAGRDRRARYRDPRLEVSAVRERELRQPATGCSDRPRSGLFQGHARKPPIGSVTRSHGCHRGADECLAHSDHEGVLRLPLEVEVRVHARHVDSPGHTPLDGFSSYSAETGHRGRA